MPEKPEDSNISIFDDGGAARRDVAPLETTGNTGTV